MAVFYFVYNGITYSIDLSTVSSYFVGDNTNCDYVAATSSGDRFIESTFRYGNNASMLYARPPYFLKITSGANQTVNVYINNTLYMVMQASAEWYEYFPSGTTWRYEIIPDPGYYITGSSTFSGTITSDVTRTCEDAYILNLTKISFYCAPSTAPASPNKWWPDAVYYDTLHTPHTVSILIQTYTGGGGTSGSLDSGTLYSHTTAQTEPAGVAYTSFADDNIRLERGNYSSTRYKITVSLTVNGYSATYVFGYIYMEDTGTYRLNYGSVTYSHTISYTSGRSFTGSGGKKLIIADNTWIN